MTDLFPDARIDLAAQIKPATIERICMNTQSGYEITVKLWYPCEPRDRYSMADASELIDGIRDGGVMVMRRDGRKTMMAESVKERWQARRKITPSALLSGDTAREPAGDGAPPAPSPVGHGVVITTTDAGGARPAHLNRERK